MKFLKNLKDFLLHYKLLVIYELVIILLVVFKASSLYTIIFNVIFLLYILIWTFISIDRQVKQDLRNKYPDLYKYIDEKKKK